MPDVSLFTASEPVSADTPVVIRMTVEVGGLEVYQESLDVDKLLVERVQDRERFDQLWLRRVHAVMDARHEPAFSAKLTHTLVGQDVEGSKST